MRYYIIAGEASGDVHASRLIAAIKAQDAAAEFRGVGGDMMAGEGCVLLQHYRDLAYMGFLPVLRHLRTILRGMKRCRQDILAWQPDTVILVDYPGFNLKMAHYVKRHSRIPVVYYIAPKIWAWKENRIRDIRRDVDALLSILPFEKDFFERKHHYPIHYVGNPTVDEVDAWLREHPADAKGFRLDNGLSSLPIIALLAGSRKQEVRDNLRRMVEAAEPYLDDYQLVLAAAPGLDDKFYRECLQALGDKWKGGKCSVVRNQTYRLLQHSTAALVTSGTATLETALLKVPQVVCYYIKPARLASLLKSLFLKVPYISLVNLTCGEEIVPELVADEMNTANIRRHLADILPGGRKRDTQLQGYERMAAILGKPGAPRRAAELIVATQTKQQMANL